MTTLPELYEKLGKLDELTFLELLDISTEELVTAFKDEIEEKYDELVELFEEDQEEL